MMIITNKQGYTTLSDIYVLNSEFDIGLHSISENAALCGGTLFTATPLRMSLNLNVRCLRALTTRKLKMIRFCATMLLAVALLSGCASMESVMSSWMGSSIDDVTAAWGAPESRINRADGGATYTWTTFSSNQYGVNQCRQTFVTDSSGTIVSWSFAKCPRFVRN